MKRTVEPKEFRDYIRNCRRKCSKKISIDERHKIFQQFWDIGDYELKNAMLGTMIRQSKVVRRSGNDDTKRTYNGTNTINNVVCRDVLSNFQNLDKDSEENLIHMERYSRQKTQQWRPKQDNRSARTRYNRTY